MNVGRSGEGGEKGAVYLERNSFDECSYIKVTKVHTGSLVVLSLVYQAKHHLDKMQ